MHNKGSCRECGAYLTPHSVCTVCKEHTSWLCGSCGRIEDYPHMHTYCRVVYKSNSGNQTQQPQIIVDTIKEKN